MEVTFTQSSFVNTLFELYIFPADFIRRKNKSCPPKKSIGSQPFVAVCRNAYPYRRHIPEHFVDCITNSTNCQEFLRRFLHFCAFFTSRAIVFGEKRSRHIGFSPNNKTAPRFLRMAVLHSASFVPRKKRALIISSQLFRTKRYTLFDIYPSAFRQPRHSPDTLKKCR